jgi:hypothetical protein
MEPRTPGVVVVEPAAVQQQSAATADQELLSFDTQSNKGEI